MDLAAFEQLLKQTMGLDAASVGPSVVKHAVHARTTACGFSRLPDYWQFLQTSNAELQELVEEVVIPETWFFRDPAAYAAMARMAQARTTENKLRILSLPCATGEEPYSIAMALTDAKFPAAQFAIDAIDISAHAIARAERAIYGKNSFRGAILDFQDRYFEPADGKHQVVESIRRQVAFKQANMFDADALPGAGIYDIIFCRNVLIYFDQATQDRAVAVLSRLLAKDGMLFVGPSETALLLNHKFASARIPLAFAFRKPGTEVPHHRAKPAKSIVAPPLPPVAPPPRPKSPPRAAPRIVPAAPAAAPPASKPSLTQAQQLADQGHLAEAAQCCEAYLKEHGPSAEAFYLLGVVRDAAGNHGEATELYRKAIYLDPSHHEALLHLAFLLKAQGDIAGSKVFSERASRAAQRRKA